MVQARRKKPPRKSIPANKQSFQGLGVLVIGIMIGSMATILWKGTQLADGGIGTGIRQIIKTSRTQDISEQRQQVQIESEESPKQETNYDFFTVLPEIEIVTSDDYDPSTLRNLNNVSSTSKEKQTVDPGKINVNSTYMLQAGSYNSNSDAEKLKAELALKGLRSTIQKVSIQGRGDFYRVRLGPYSNYGEMILMDQVLAQQGIKALRLKISNGG